MGAAVEEERKDSLQHLMGVEHILSTVMHQILDINAMWQTISVNDDSE